MLTPKDGVVPSPKELQRKLLAFATLLPDDADIPEDAYLAEKIQEYKEAAARQTTNPGQREIRQERFLDIIGRL
jgi:hypothetical protein